MVAIYSETIEVNRSKYQVSLENDLGFLESLNKYIEYNLELIKDIKKEWMKEIFVAIYQATNNELYTDLFNVDLVWKNEFKDMMIKLSESMDDIRKEAIDDVLDIMYAAYMQAYAIYIIDTGMSFKCFKNQLIKQVNLLLTNMLMK